MASKASRSDHYLAIAEFYGRMLVEDLSDPNIPEFVLVHSARRAAHFALTAVRLAEKRQARREAMLPARAWAPARPAFTEAPSLASLS